MERVSSHDEAYGAFAYAYDAALGRQFFQAIEPLLRNVVERYADERRLHLDLACGTGFAVEWFEQEGYRSFGTDLSIPMLDIARSRTRNVVASDMRLLSLAPRMFSRVTSLYDSLNHLLDERDIASTFRQVSEVLHGDGLFIFDMNHPNACDDVWSNPEPFVAEGEGYHLEIATSFERRSGRAHGHVRGWVVRKGARVPIDEIHEQRPYAEKTITRLLRSARLDPVELIHFDPFGQASSRGKPKIKMLFVARKSAARKSRA